MDVNIKKEKKRNQLLKSAYYLFTKKGFYKTTIQDISKRAGVGKGTFYLYFKDKEEIRDTLIVMKSSQLLKRAIEAEPEPEKPDDFAALIISVADYLIDYLSYDQDLLKFISKSLSYGLFINSGKYESKGDDIFDMEKYVHESLTERNIKLKDPSYTIFTIIELISSTCYSTIIEESPTGIEEYKPFLFDTIKLIVDSQLIKE